VAPPAEPLVATASAPAPPAAAAQDVVGLIFAELPNFHRVDANVYRGGQPGEGGMARLKEVGVRTVLNLRYERQQGLAEEAAARVEGLQYFSIPMYGLVRPSDRQITRALEILQDPDNWPVFVHCKRGSDRTGAVVGVYRVANSNWTAEQAIDEAMALGMLRAEALKRSYIRDFYAKSEL
jgi:protein tyrosine/serine phosphatase